MSKMSVQFRQLLWFGKLKGKSMFMLKPCGLLSLSSHHQEAPVQTQVRQALARPRTAHALRPSAASSQRILGDLRSTKWSTRREERYRILSSHRAGLSAPAEQQTPQMGASECVEETGKETDKCWGLGEIQVVDLIHEDGEDQDKPSGKVSW